MILAMILIPPPLNPAQLSGGFATFCQQTQQTQLKNLAFDVLIQQQSWVTIGFWTQQNLGC